MAESELDGMVDGLRSSASASASGLPSITALELLRIAAGGKTQVLRESVIKRLCDEMEAKLLGKLNDQEIGHDD